MGLAHRGKAMLYLGVCHLDGGDQETGRWKSLEYHTRTAGNGLLQMLNLSTLSLSNICVRVRCMHTTAHVWRSEDSSWERIHPGQMMSSGN